MLARHDAGVVAKYACRQCLPDAETLLIPPRSEASPALLYCIGVVVHTVLVFPEFARKGMHLIDLINDISVCECTNYSCEMFDGIVVGWLHQLVWNKLTQHDETFFL